MNCEELIREHWISDKTIWWSIYWKFIILAVFNYKSNQRDDITNFFSSIKNLIPCDECASHFKIKMTLLYPFWWTNKENLMEFVVNVYNTIEIFSGREWDWNRSKLVDKYLWEEFKRAVKICNW